MTDKLQLFTDAVSPIADKLQKAGHITKWEVFRNTDQTPSYCGLRLTWNPDQYNMTCVVSVLDDEEEVTDEDIRLRIAEGMSELVFLYKTNEIEKDGIDPRKSTDQLYQWLMKNDPRFEKLEKDVMAIVIKDDPPTN